MEIREIIKSFKAKWTDKQIDEMEKFVECECKGYSEEKIKYFLYGALVRD